MSEKGNSEKEGAKKISEELSEDAVNFFNYVLKITQGMYNSLDKIDTNKIDSLQKELIGKLKEVLEKTKDIISKQVGGNFNKDELEIISKAADDVIGLMKNCDWEKIRELLEKMCKVCESYITQLGALVIVSEASAKVEEIKSTIERQDATIVKKGHEKGR